MDGRALTCTALKPQGSSVEYLAHLARTFALAGIDVIKDDHGIANQAYHPFAERVPAVQKAIAEANRETGGHTIYAPTFSGGGHSLAEQTRIARESAVKMALVAPMLVGIPAFVELQADLDIPVMAHPAFAGASASRRQCCSASSSASSAPTRRSSPTTAGASATAARPASRSRRRRARRGTTCAPRCRCPPAA